MIEQSYIARYSNFIKKTSLNYGKAFSFHVGLNILYGINSTMHTITTVNTYFPMHLNAYNKSSEF